MQVRLANSGEVAEGVLALPESIRERMGIHAGDILEAHVESTGSAERLVLTLAKGPEVERRFIPEGRIVEDPLTGWPVLDFGPDAPELTNEQVLEMLADFP